MATLPSIPLGESVDITFDFERSLPVIVRFSLDISYFNSTVNASLTEPSVSFDGVNFTRVVNNLLDVPAGKKYFIVRARLNNDPSTRVDDSVQVSVVPVTNTHLITNPEGFTAIVELKNVSHKPKLTVDAATASVGEGSVAKALYTFSSATPAASDFDFKLTFTGATSDADIGPITYTLNSGTPNPLNKIDKITVPAGTTTLEISFNVLQDGFNDTSEGATVSLQPAPYDLVTLPRTPVSKVFTFQDTYVPPAGTLLRYYCTGKDQYAEYADGSGGKYTNLIKVNSTSCGYVIPPAGTLLSQHCAGYDKIGEYADGNDGSYFEIIALEDSSCGYVPDAPNPQTDLVPTKYDPTTKGTTVTLSNGDRNFAGERRDLARTEFSAMYGKWYIEHTILIPTDKQQPTSIGVVTASHPVNDWVGSNINGWAWWPHEGTKFHGDVQEFFGPALSDGDVIGILLDIQGGVVSLQLNGVDIGVLYSNLKPFTKLYFVTSALTSSFSRTNFGQTVFAYPVPSGYYPGFGVPTNPPPERATLMGYFCSGLDQWKTLADGKGGTYTEVHKKNATECGYVPPPPEAGTNLGTVCQGFDLYNRIADGNYGETLVLSAINSRSCGYVPPPPPPFTPTTLDTNFKSASTVIDANGYQAIPVGSVRTVASVYSGRWSWEVSSNTNFGVVGITTTDLTNTQNLGVTATSFGLDLATGEIVNNGIRAAYTTPVPAGGIVSVHLDFVAETLSFSVNGTNLGKAFDIPRATFYAAASSPGAATITFNMGIDTQTYAAPQDHINGFGVAATIYSRKGTYLSYSCNGTTRRELRADGGGGSYAVLITNAPSCGYVPPKPAGSVVRDFCVGTDKWTEYNDGNYGTYSDMTEYRSIACGYKPAGALISTRCQGYTKIGSYSDGEGGAYDQVVEEYSRDCGFNMGGGGGSSETSLDPNLVITQDGQILFDTLNNQITGEIVFDVENTRPVVPAPPIADSVLGYSCFGSTKFNILANGYGGSYTKSAGWDEVCGPKPFFADGLPSYTTIVDSSVLTFSTIPVNSSVAYDSSRFNTCFVPTGLASKTSAKIDLDISFAQNASPTAPAVGVCLLTPTNVYVIGFFYTVNKMEYSASNNPNRVGSNTVLHSNIALPANTLPESGRLLLTLIVEPDGGFLKFVARINGVQVHSLTSIIPAASFTPGIYLRSSVGELFDFSFTNYP